MHATISCDLARICHGSCYAQDFHKTMFCICHEKQYNAGPSCEDFYAILATNSTFPPSWSGEKIKVAYGDDDYDVLQGASSTFMTDAEQ